MRIRIESSGSAPWQTKIVNAETGELVRGVRRVSIQIGVSPDIKLALLEFVDFDLEGELEAAGQEWELP